MSETSPEVHKRMRSYLAGAFSDRSIVEQEEIIATHIDKFIHVVGTRGSRSLGVDFSKLLESLTFDITGDLSFGETFGALDSGRF